MLKRTRKPISSSLVALALATALGLSGCATTANTAVNSSGWLTPEPLAVPYRTELAIARLTELLSRAELTEQQSAQLFYDRGVMYDSVGLMSLARLDFMRALRLQPDMADAYNFIGIHHTLSGEFDLAYEAFDSALELAPDHEYAYLNRGIAFYYADRTELAIADLEQFQQLKPEDTYRTLWLYLADLQLSADEAHARLAYNLTKLDTSDWAANIAFFFNGQLTEQQLLDSVLEDLSTPKQLAERLCEVYFYLAKWYASKQQPEQALEYYKKVLSTNVFEFVEHRYARLEIAILRGESQQQAPQDEHH